MYLEIIFHLGWLWCYRVDILPPELICPRYKELSLAGPVENRVNTGAQVLAHWQQALHAAGLLPFKFRERSCCILGAAATVGPREK